MSRKPTHLYVAIHKGTMQYLQTACGLGLFMTPRTSDESMVTCGKCKKYLPKYTKSFGGVHQRYAEQANKDKAE